MGHACESHMNILRKLFSKAELDWQDVGIIVDVIKDCHGEARTEHKAKPWTLCIHVPILKCDNKVWVKTARRRLQTNNKVRLQKGQSKTTVLLAIWHRYLLVTSLWYYSSVQSGGDSGANPRTRRDCLNHLLWEHIRIPKKKTQLPPPPVTHRW